MIEYGLSVSLNGTPKTPAPPRGQSPEGCECDAPGRRRARKMNFGDLIVVDGNNREKEEEEGSEYGSISPRVCFSEMVRRLDFTMESAELSPVPFSSVSVSVSVSRNNGAGGAGAGGGAGGGAGAGGAVAVFAEEDVCCSALLQEQQPSVGECTVCYQPLQERRNHVFTLCGHLFCVQCLLKWWDTSSTCPICRAELLNVEDEDDDNDDDTVIYDDAALDAALDAVLGDDDAEHALEIEGRRGEVVAWMQPPSEYRIGDPDRDSDDSDDSDDYNPRQEPYYPNITSLNRYLHQDIDLLWSVIVMDETDPNYDDTVYQLLYDEISGLRENREIAMILFARMRFRETLFQTNLQFLGSVCSGSWVHVLDWVDIIQRREHHHVLSTRSVMYEFVIRRGSDISPNYEVSLFGFIKDVTMQEIENVDNGGDGGGSGGSGGDGGSGGVDPWENMVEYAFVADVFTPTDFYIQGVWGNPNSVHSFRSYGSYDMTDGTITTQEVTITFSQIRRLYRIHGLESCQA